MGARIGRRPAGGRRRCSMAKGRGQGLGDRASPLEALGVCVWEIERVRRRSSGGRWGSGSWRRWREMGSREGRLGLARERGWAGPNGLQLQEAHVAGWGALGVSLFSLP